MTELESLQSAVDTAYATYLSSAFRAVSAANATHYASILSYQGGAGTAFDAIGDAAASAAVAYGRYARAAKTFADIANMYATEAKRSISKMGTLPFQFTDTESTK